MKPLRMTPQELAALPCIHDGRDYRVLLQTDSPFGVPVVIKVPRSDPVPPEQAKRIADEHRLTADIHLPGARRACARIQVEGRPAVALEYFEGTTLREARERERGSLSETLELCVRIAAVLEGMHRQGLVHRNLAASHILVSPNRERVMLIGFGGASRMNGRGVRPEVADLSAGTLAFMSPEQTGRVNRLVDQRADLYSFGAVLYEVFTGKPPFDADNPAELVYLHLAQTPVPPREKNPEVPVPVSDIVMRLLAKNPDERYQSAFGVKADLETCLEQLRRTGRVGEVELGRADDSGVFRLPERLYDREAELGTLQEALRSAGGGAGAVVLISGRAGTGKTALSEALRQHAKEQDAYFIRGEYEGSQRHVPYSGLIQAFNEWINLILTESAGELAQWKARLLAASGGDAGLLIDLLPRLTLVLGSQPPAPDLGLSEAQHRFHHLLRSFVLAFARREHPPVLFLDNLQWADQASLQLLHLLLPGIESQPIVFVGAYRDDEVGAGHPLAALLDTLEPAMVRTIPLGALGPAAVERLIADSLRMDVAGIRPLAQLALEKTGGNALFLRQLLQSLHEEGLLVFNEEDRRWTWDAAAIRERTVIGSVAALMAEKIGKLPEETRSALSISACIGIRFELGTLAETAELSAPEAAGRLSPAVEAGLLQTVTLQRTPGAAPAPGFEFPHDRVRQAAYMLLPQKQRRLTHLRIGRILLAQTEGNAPGEGLFEVADQLNEGFRHITDDEERQRLVTLNLMAGRKAMRAAAYQAAIRYLSMGIGLLSPNRWERSAELTLSLLLEAVAAEYLSANFDRAALLSAEVLEHTTDLFTRVRVHELRILFFTAQDQNALAIRAGLSALSELGVTLPAGAGEASAGQQRDLAEAVSRVEDLARLPEMTDPRHLATLRILMHLAAPAQRTDLPLLHAVIGEMVRLSVKHGNSAMAAFAYGWYGALLCGSPGGVETGYRLGQLSLAVLRRFPAPELDAKVAFLFNAHVRHWKEHARESIAPLAEVCRRGVETGDLEYTGLGAIHHCGYLFCTGAPLARVRRAQAEHLETIEQRRLSFHAQLARVWRQTVANLCGGAGDPTRLTGEHLDEAKCLPEWIAENNAMLVQSTLTCRMMLQVLFGDHAGAVASGRQAEEYARAAHGLLYQADHCFYYALSLLSQHATAGDEERREHLRIAAPLLVRLGQWALLAPMNFAHKHALVEAEHARATGENGRAMERFNDAIRLSRENGYLHDEALSCEREAVFYSSLGRDDIAGVSMRRAAGLFKSWGASRKVEDLEQRWRPLVRRESPLLDTAAVLQASHMLSEEIHLDLLLEKLMRIAIENAGAERGVLIQKSGAGLMIQAQSAGQGGRIETMLARPVETSGEVALSVVNFVARTQSHLVLGDACRDPTFGADPYISERRARSLLCLPIVHQAKLFGLLYLENNLTTDVFNADRLELLKALASQAAISMENAALYAELEGSIAALRDSEQKIRAILDQTFQLIGLLSKDGTVLHANQTALRFAGVSEEAVLGKPFWDTPWWGHSADQQQRLRAAIREAAEGKLVRYEATNVSADGEIHDIDFSLKPVTDSTGRVVQLLPEGRDVTERRRAEEALRASEHKYRLLVANAGEGILIVQDGLIRFTNPRALSLLECSEPELLGAPFAGFVHADDRQATLARHFLTDSKDSPEISADTAGPSITPIRILSRTKKIRWVQLTAAELPWEGRPATLCFLRDVTEEVTLEAQFRQAQKMEAVGSLAGGIAHDFNNILLIINGHAEMALESLREDDPMREDLNEIARAGKRAEGLTRQLLAFSRKQMLKPALLDLNELVFGTEKMLKRLIGENIELTTVPSPDLGPIRADPGQVEQIIMNLATNARDAMPQGGQLTIKTDNVELDEQYAAGHVGVMPGPHVRLSVSDTGCGMDAETLSRAFEPFFTTKAVGKGTGLGLATVYGIMRQSGGTIWVDSEPGRGTTFELYFPRVQGTVEQERPAAGAAAQGAGETVLVVEDEDALRSLVVRILKRARYRVIEARNGVDALAAAERHPDRIDLLLTDVVMPQMGGRELAKRLLPLRPELRVLYMTGYTDQSVMLEVSAEEAQLFLQKPFSAPALLSRMRHVLEHRR